MLLPDKMSHKTGHLSDGYPAMLQISARQTFSQVTNTLLKQACLAAGATLVGKTHMDELAYSLNGENVHYGTPVNPACPDRIPGGSSSGSAVRILSKIMQLQTIVIAYTLADCHNSCKSSRHPVIADLGCLCELACNPRTFSSKQYDRTFSSTTIQT